MRVVTYKVPIEPIGSMSYTLEWEKALLQEVGDEFESSALTAQAISVNQFNQSRLKMWQMEKTKSPTITQQKII